MTVTSDEYTALITSEHQQKPLFKAVVALTVQGACDQQNVLETMPSLYDLDNAVGSQLDTTGVWIGLTRFQDVPTIGLVQLDDADYRTLLRAKILANHYDGGMESLNAIVAQIFPGTGVQLFVVDNQDMSMTIYLIGTLSSLQLALLKGGLLVPKPETVLLNGIIQVTGPLFGLDQENTFVSGLDVGAFEDFL